MQPRSPRISITAAMPRSLRSGHGCSLDAALQDAKSWKGKCEVQEEVFREWERKVRCVAAAFICIVQLWNGAS